MSKRFGLALLGGLWGGAIAGLAEVGIVAWTSSSLPELGFVPYAIIGYGLLGLVIGVGVGAAELLLRPFMRWLPNPFGASAGLSLGALVLIVGRYHVNQRVFHEELSPFTAGGALAYAGLLAVAGFCLLLAIAVGRVLAKQRHGPAVGLGVLAALVLVSVVVGRSRVPTDTVRGAAPAFAAGAERPNVILIIADTLRADALSSYGSKEVRTPAIDSLAADGVRFTHAFTQSSWTRPSIATILTGLHPGSHGATHKTALLRDSAVTAAEAFRAEGYWTAAFVSNINIAPVFNFHQGFAEYTYLAPSFYFGASDTAARLTLYKLLRVLRERFLADRMYAENYYQDAPVVTQRTVEWLGSSPQQPFFLLVHYMDPHDPYFEIPYSGKGIARVSSPNPPAERRDELLDLYHDNVEFMDQQIAQILKRLEDVGLYDETVIGFASDHGEEFREHGGWWHGTTLYEEQLHVPLIFKLPRGRDAGRVDTSLVRTVDIAPTLLAEAGIDPPPTYEGEHLFVSGARPRLLLAEEDLEGNVLASVRIGHWKLITANPSNPRGLGVVELYDLESDPGEKKNLADAEPGRVSDMLAELTRGLDQLGTRGGFGR